MNFTAQNASRKWAYGAFRRLNPAMVTAAAVALLLGMPTGPAVAAKASRPAPWADLFRDVSPRERGAPRATARRAAVPLPKPRPSEAPSAERDKPDKQQQASPPNGKPGEQAAPAPQPTPQPSACRLALTDAIAIAPSIPDIKGAGGCGGEDLVRLEAIVLPDKRQVSVKPAAILRCPMASALAEWIRSDIAPLAERLGSSVSDLDNFDSFECRGRNRIVGARLSEHGRANALDVRAFKFADGSSISLTDRTVPRGLRESVLHSACTRFSTVLGPGSDWYHEDHIHLDLMERRGNYRICQWDVWDPLPQTAPLLPAERPEEAPPREAAAKPDEAKSDAKSGAESGANSDAKPDAKSAAEPEAEKKNAEKPDQAEPPREEKPAKKKRRQNRRS
ncbi:extensin family protein [Bradyrhizobium sp. AUGA SZCCT0283]|uniref:extensin family protein n=1 Tax=Bradyrhizobium sp. AUGA SZCCT0283 TaxID=2807671 RepID=UPI001BAA5711|nr:extensin family protein [Bradyrhizobium sp. AUGA SZCCT0283]MBR1276028.1 extensin family protein [Bradyrhizobium sp. AUGA SZCCT0283]